MIKSNQEAWRMRIALPERFNVEWMLNHIRTSSYGLPYRFVDQRVLRRPLWLAGAPVVAEFDLSQTGAMATPFGFPSRTCWPAGQEENRLTRRTYDTSPIPVGP